MREYEVDGKAFTVSEYMCPFTSYECVGKRCAVAVGFAVEDMTAWQCGLIPDREGAMSNIIEIEMDPSTKDATEGDESIDEEIEVEIEYDEGGDQE